MRKPSFIDTRREIVSNGRGMYYKRIKSRSHRHRKKYHLYIAGILVVLVFLAWGKSLYRYFKYKKEPAPEPTQLETLMGAISTFNHDVSGNVEELLTAQGASLDDVEGSEALNGEEAATGDAENEQPSEEEPAPTEVAANPNVEVLPKLNIDMPFYSQAPHADWGLPYQEACEEASVLLVANIYKKKNWSLDEFNREILKIVDWEMERFGAYEHTTVAQTADMIREYLSLNTRIHENPTFEDVQKILSSGHLIVAPFAGKELKNPNYTNGGPKYHMMVIKGYDAGKMQIVTHDVGTRNGKDYVYTWDKIQQSLHDWEDGDIQQGAKRFIEVWG